MKRPLKVVAIIVGSLAGLILVAATTVYALSEMRVRKTYSIPIAELQVPAEPEVVAHGRHLAAARGCTDCHAEDLGGQVFINEPPMGVISAANLTSGRGGIASRYDDAAWERAIRHGVGPDGRALAIMPSKEYSKLGEEDIAALIAYLKTVPPVDRELPARRFGPVGRTLIATGQLPVFSAVEIDHNAPRPATPPIGETVEYGRYVGAICAGCHGPGLSGGRYPAAPPEAPHPTNITMHETGLASWTEEDFFRALREGVRPDGTQLRAEYMPWPVTAHMTDTELRALWLYLQSVPPKEIGNR